MNENESLTVTLTLDNDQELECAVLSIFSDDENHDYIALLPLDENGDNSDGDVYIYRFIDHGEDEEPELENILEDDEYEKATQLFLELMEAEDSEDVDLDEIDF